MKKIISRAALAATAIAFGVPGAYAGPSTGQLPVTATVAGGCTVTGSTVNFSTVTTPVVLGAEPTGQGSVEQACTAGITPISIVLGGNVGSRAMNAATTGGSLPYILASSAANRTSGLEWGYLNGPPLSSGTHSYPVYGRLTATGSQPADNYTDSITITITY